MVAKCYECKLLKETYNKTQNNMGTTSTKRNQSSSQPAIPASVSRVVGFLHDYHTVVTLRHHSRHSLVQLLLLYRYNFPHSGCNSSVLTLSPKKKWKKKRRSKLEKTAMGGWIDLYTFVMNLHNRIRFLMSFLFFCVAFFFVFRDVERFFCYSLNLYQFNGFCFFNDSTRY